jgi:chromosome segregation ATPase
VAPEEERKRAMAIFGNAAYGIAGDIRETSGAAPGELTIDAVRRVVRDLEAFRVVNSRLTADREAAIRERNDATMACQRYAAEAGGAKAERDAAVARAVAAEQERAECERKMRLSVVSQEASVESMMAAEEARDELRRQLASSRNEVRVLTEERDQLRAAEPQLPYPIESLSVSECYSRPLVHLRLAGGGEIDVRLPKA